MTTNKQLRELAERATPGAWGKDGVYVCTTITAGETIYVQTWDAVAESHQESNAQFIAAANPATVLALLDKYEALQAECEKLRKDAERFRTIRDRLAGPTFDKHFFLELYNVGAFDQPEDIDDSVDDATQEQTK